MRIYNVGVYPPPFGGVSIHIKRLHEYLLEQGVESVVLDLSTEAKDAEGVLQRNARDVAKLINEPKAVVHFHVDSSKFILLMYLMSLRHRVVYSFHDERFMRHLAALPAMRRSTQLRMLRKVHAVVADTEANCSFAKESLGLPRVEMIPEYIRGGAANEQDLERLRPIRSRFRFLISSNAFKVAFHNGEDLYGIDILVEMMRRIGPACDAGLIFLIPGEGHEDYIEQLEARVRYYGLEDRFFFLRERLVDALSLWSVSDVVIRATNTDGNSLTIHEALHEGVPVIASDCVQRPTGTILFKNRDVDDLIAQTCRTLENLESEREKIKGLAGEDNAARILDLYRSVWEGRA
jgi:glycosyltransferase involved in cell wall biosynthesis